MNEDYSQLADLIKDINYAMMTTISSTGNLHSRPMATMNPPQDFSGSLWFFTRLDSLKVEDIKDRTAVNLAYANPENQRYVSLSGKAKIIEDKQKMKELWTSDLLAWFPDGLRDPQIALIKVEVESAEVWDTPTSRRFPESPRHMDLRQ